jgi:hypothetical protein
MIEIWKDVKGYEGLYKISNLGNLLSLVFKNNKVTKKRKLVKKTFLDKKGYLRTVITKNKIKKNFFIHRLVAIAFIPNPNNKPHINHKNLIRTDNKVENLEWCTQKENIHHFLQNGIVTNRKKVIITNKKTLKEFVFCSYKEGSIFMNKSEYYVSTLIGLKKFENDEFTWKKVGYKEKPNEGTI